MDPELLDEIARTLRTRRAALLKEVADTEADLASIGEERESELEERARTDRAARLLARLDDRERREIDEIHAALQRVIDGTYGRCQRCRRAIPVARLRALPATRTCVACAGRAAAAPAAEAEEPAAGPAPPDLSLLSDPEREETLRELICADGRIDADELRIVCRHGVVRLEGAVPSDVERQIVVKLVTDVAGFEEVVDHLRVDELLAQRAGPGRPVRREGPRRREPVGTEDLVESEEEGLSYLPPDDPGSDEA